MQYYITNIIVSHTLLVKENHSFRVNEIVNAENISEISWFAKCVSIAT